MLDGASVLASCRKGRWATCVERCAIGLPEALPRVGVLMLPGVIDRDAASSVRGLHSIARCRRIHPRIAGLSSRILPQQWHGLYDVAVISPPPRWSGPLSSPAGALANA